MAVEQVLELYVEPKEISLLVHKIGFIDHELLAVIRQGDSHLYFIENGPLDMPEDRKLLRRAYANLDDRLAPLYVGFERKESFRKNGLMVWHNERQYIFTMGNGNHRHDLTKFLQEQIDKGLTPKQMLGTDPLGFQIYDTGRCIGEARFCPEHNVFNMYPVKE